MPEQQITQPTCYFYRLRCQRSDETKRSGKKRIGFSWVCRGKMTSGVVGWNRHQRSEGWRSIITQLSQCSIKTSHLALWSQDLLSSCNTELNANQTNVHHWLIWFINSCLQDNFELNFDEISISFESQFQPITFRRNVRQSSLWCNYYFL